MSVRKIDDKVRLLVDGVPQLPIEEGDAALFLFPSNALEAPDLGTFSPAKLSGSAGPPLGLCLTGRAPAGAAEMRVHFDDLDVSIDMPEGRASRA